MDRKHCDICDSIKDVERYYFPYDRVMDASGNGYNDENEIIDMCPKCALKIHEKISQELAKKIKKEEFDLSDKYIIGEIGKRLVQKYIK